MDIWSDILQHSALPLTWGFKYSSVKKSTGGTTFRVNTDFIVGMVEIQQTNDCYTVTIKPDNLVGGFVYQEVSPENLVSLINGVIKEGVLSDNTSHKPLHAAS